MQPTHPMVCFGGSVPGPEHVRKGQANQDAWVLRRSKKSVIAVVADGLGSTQLGREGARAACRAGVVVAGLISRFGIEPGLHTVALLRALWHQLVATHDFAQCGSTCLFVHIDMRSRLFAAQIGDGIVAIRRANGEVTCLKRDEPAFQNSTQTIGSVGANAWVIWRDVEFSSGDMLLMASDGIAEDLQPERLGDFIAYLAANYEGRSPRERATALRKELRCWATPHHRDDKTLVFLARL